MGTALLVMVLLTPFTAVPASVSGFRGFRLATVDVTEDGSTDDNADVTGDVEKNDVTDDNDGKLRPPCCI